MMPSLHQKMQLRETPYTRSSQNAPYRNCLRACFADLKVEVPVYARGYEKELRYRPLRQRMGLSVSPSTRDAQRCEDAGPCPARHTRCHLLRPEKRLSLAAHAGRLSTLADGFLPLPPVP